MSLASEMDDSLLCIFVWKFKQVLKDGLSALHVPYPYGFAIILLTVLVKVATFPLSKKQVIVAAPVFLGSI